MNNLGHKIWFFFFGKTRRTSDNSKIAGKVTVQKRTWNAETNSYNEWEIICKDKPNLLTNDGRDWMKAQVYTNTSAGTRGSGYIAVTENGTAPADGDTTLTSEITTNGLGRADATTKTNNAGAATAVIEHTFTASGAFSTVQKAGLFNASSAGTMSHENTFTSTALATNDQLKVTWNLTLND